MFGLALDTWNTLTLFFLAAAAVAAAAIVVSQLAVIKLQKAEAIAAKDEFEKYKLGVELEIARANERTKEAELALAELRSPRNLDPAPFRKALEGITPEKVEILYAEPCSDCFWLAQWIYNFLGPKGGLGWTISKFEPLSPRTDGRFAGLPLAIGVHANPWGVTVVARGNSHDWGDNSAASALMRALMKSMGKAPMLSGNLDSELPEGTFRVVVAPKT